MNGPIRTKWGSLGFETSWTGYPTNDGVSGLKDGGSSQSFEYGGAQIIYSPATGAHFVLGGIRHAWLNAKSQDGWLGYPTTDEIGGLKDNGARQGFQGGNVYWSPKYGSQYVHGAIGNHWILLGAENSKYGYPTSGEFAWNGGIRQNFEGGYITWNDKGEMFFS
jgi:uncharacterized protein with LGFP repeats